MHINGKFNRKRDQSKPYKGHKRALIHTRGKFKGKPGESKPFICRKEL